MITVWRTSRMRKERNPHPKGLLRRRMRMPIPIKTAMGISEKKTSFAMKDRFVQAAPKSG
jgi:hypothetical protein